MYFFIEGIRNKKFCGCYYCTEFVSLARHVFLIFTFPFLGPCTYFVQWLPAWVNRYTIFTYYNLQNQSSINFFPNTILSVTPNLKKNSSYSLDRMNQCDQWIQSFKWISVTFLNKERERETFIWLGMAEYRHILENCRFHDCTARLNLNLIFF